MQDREHKFAQDDDQHDERPSAYRDFLAAGREGFQHVSSWLTRPEYDETMARALASGAGVAHEGSIAPSGVRFAYFATDRLRGGLLYEIADVMEPAIYPMMEMIADARKMLALELVEVNPIIDVQNQTAILGVGLVTSALGKKIL